MLYLLLIPAVLSAPTSNAVANYDAFSMSGMHCTIGNNAEAGEHRGGYNGVFALGEPGGGGNVFVPAYAGLNLEHYFDAGPVPADSQVFFEPRRTPMTFTRVDAQTAELYQAPTPVYGVESWTRFTLSEPHYVDMRFRCVPHKAGLKGNLLGVFWASYIQYPQDKSIYFLSEGSTLDKPMWFQYCTLKHNRDSTVCHEKDNYVIPFETGGESLFRNIAPVRYAKPFFYGRIGGQVLIYLFKPGPCIRFSHSPSGGGATPDGQAQNPAWDFQLIIPEYEAGNEYAMEMRLIYKPWVSREDVINEVRQYLKR